MVVHLVKRPDFYDVIVAENMFGDIISDLGAATAGGMGISPSGEIGDGHALFQGAHARPRTLPARASPARWPRCSPAR
jgi:3-isopropylmalate dehydrogenase